MTRARTTARARLFPWSTRGDVASSSSSSSSPSEERRDDDDDEWRHDRAAQRAASTLATHLSLRSPSHVRDVLAAMVLSECAYKRPSLEVRGKAAEIQSHLPRGVARVRAVSASVDKRAKHRYLVADSEHAVYVAFMGTADARDLLADAAYLQTPLRRALDGGKVGTRPGDGVGTRARETGPHRHLQRALVHRGFAARAIATRDAMRALWRAARREKKRLVLCGHSLGGAVASLSGAYSLHWSPYDGVGVVNADP